jgi:hypothetical protein
VGADLPRKTRGDKLCFGDGLGAGYALLRIIGDWR